ncbi:ABC transporter ATP-binding protein [Mucilaginibacter sp. UR6-11]|uniref:ABC transporter ATP-binding protein n=1 Tax=Mucilaginibacter sp. UR6-11 TaxID=1435644 RepID=UPI001E47A100|nr:ABC transporter ATP-binding protein [Mucilaginibacter sp. UR6-11]MCC8424342.1 ABC transporter ATP-binding protein/permease [Mucilaginibacter sp. UR6-11]
MKTYFRLLSFARPIEKFAIPYILFTLLYVFFSTMVLVLLGPLLNALFPTNTCNTAAVATVSQTGHPPSIFHMTELFKYYLQYYIIHYGGAWGALKFVCLVIIVFVFLGNLFRYLSQRTMENLRVHTLLNLRKTVFNNVIDLHLAYFSNERKGDIISKVSSDVQVVQYSVTGTLQVIFKEPLTMIAYMIALVSISAKLTLFSLLVIPVSAFIISRIVKRLKAQAIAAQQSYGNMISYLDEALSGIKIIKAFNATDFIKNRFNKENQTYSNIARSMARRQQLASPVSETLSVTMISFIVMYGGYLILNHKSDLDAGHFIAYIGIFSQLMRPAKAISDSFSNIHSGIAAGERVLALIDEKPLITDAPDAIVVTEFNEGLHFNKVNFAYDEKVVLSDITFTVPKGKTVALVGPSGGGKSTLMDLIPRFMDPKSGTISIDDHEIKHITANSLRGLMGVVNQESILFNDSIYNNIAFGKTDATPEQVEAAARIANAHNFILETENGYNTNIGDRGTKLSGGQRQRICIARAVLTNPPIMLLDEATSALDTESEKLVQDALNNLMKNRTSLIIAHRLSTIQNADIIVVLENGRIVETGNHQELINHNGLYRKLIDMQTFSAD